MCVLEWHLAFIQKVFISSLSFFLILYIIIHFLLTLTFNCFFCWYFQQFTSSKTTLFHIKVKSLHGCVNIKIMMDKCWLGFCFELLILLSLFWLFTLQRKQCISLSTKYLYQSLLSLAFVAKPHTFSPYSFTLLLPSGNLQTYAVSPLPQISQLIGESNTSVAGFTFMIILVVFGMGFSFLIFIFFCSFAFLTTYLRSRSFNALSFSLQEDGKYYSWCILYQ